jgi:hypothetical protein
MKEKKRSFFCQASVLDFLKASSGTCVSSPVFLDIVDDDPGDTPTIQEEVPPP